MPPEPQKVSEEQQQLINVSCLSEDKLRDELPPVTTESSSLTTPENSPIVSPSPITDTSLTTPSDSSPGNESPSSDFMQQVHVLEHAMNGYCFNQVSLSY